MQLFSQAVRACGGIIWDLSANNLEQQHGPNRKPYFAWRSGYYAKTEFNLVVRGGEVVLLNGREQNLVTLEQLREQNNQIAARATSKCCLQPFNEVIAKLTNHSIAALFCRTLAPADVVFLMGLRLTLQQTLEALESQSQTRPRSRPFTLPLLHIDPVHGCRAISEQEQQECVRWCIANAVPGPGLHPRRHRATSSSTGTGTSANAMCQYSPIQTPNQSTTLSPTGVAGLFADPPDTEFALGPPAIAIKDEQRSNQWHKWRQHLPHNGHTGAKYRKQLQQRPAKSSWLRHSIFGT